MKKIIGSIMVVTNLISLASMLLLGAVGAIYEVLNEPYFVKLLAQINIAWNLGTFWLIFLVCFIVFIGTVLFLKRN
jgi:hypothetical protein